MFINSLEGVKVNGAYYATTFCPEGTARHTPDIAGRLFWLSTDGAPRIEHTTLSFPERETPDFIPPTLLPPNSPDLNPVGYSIWSVLQEKVYRSRIANVDELKTRLIDEWALFDQSIFVLLSASGVAV